MFVVVQSLATGVIYLLWAAALDFIAERVETQVCAKECKCNGWSCWV